MKKLVAVLFLSGVSALALLGSSDVSAQDKKKPKVEPKASAGVVEIIESKDGKYRFTIRDADGKYLAGSPVGHATEKEVKEIVEELKTILSSAKFVSKKSEGGKEKEEKKEKK